MKITQSPVNLFGVSEIDRIIAWILLLSGIVIGISGFWFSLHDDTLFGIIRLLHGLSPALAGGYHAYSLEAGKYESRLLQTALKRQCVMLYLISLLLGIIVYSAPTS